MSDPHATRQTFGFHRRPDGKREWSFTGRWLKWVALLLGIVVTGAGVAKIVDESVWLLTARDHTDQEIDARVPAIIDGRLAGYVTKRDEEHTVTEAKDEREKIMKAVEKFDKRLQFIYDQAYIQAYGHLPPKEPPRGRNDP